MKRALQIIVALGLVGMFLMTPVAAATSQGLEWGVAYGSSFDFTFTSDRPGLAINEEITLNITAMPGSSIPDPLSTWASIPDPTIGFWWANGSSMGFTAILFLGVFSTGGHFAVPTGNFTLLDTLLKAALTGETITTDSDTWNVVWSMDINASAEYRMTSTYALADGFLAEYKWETWNTVDDILVESVQAIRNNIPAGPAGPGLDIVQLLQDNLLLVGAGVVVLGIFCLYCAKKR